MLREDKFLKRLKPVVSAHEYDLCEHLIIFALYHGEIDFHESFLSVCEKALAKAGISIAEIKKAMKQPKRLVKTNYVVHPNVANYLISGRKDGLNSGDVSKADCFRREFKNVQFEITDGCIEFGRCEITNLGCIGAEAAVEITAC